MSLRNFYSAIFLMPAILLGADLTVGRGAGDRFELSGSILQDVGAAATKAHITRSTLRPEELQASMRVVVSLEMRNAREFHTRIDGGAKISQSEMEARYLPSQAEYNRVAAWMKSEGFVLDKNVDPKRLNIFAHHSVSEVGRVFQVKFARVTTADGEFSSAVTAPSVPGAYAPSILGVLGLQPHIRFRKHYTLARPHGADLAPADVRYAYNVPSGLTGAGQSIAVIMEGPGPVPADLSKFWSMCDSTQTASNYTIIPIDGGAESPSGAEFEGALDVEWAGGMAPGASLRFYDLWQLSDIDAIEALTQISTDRLTVPNLNVVTMSFGSSEYGTSADDNLAFHNLFGALVNDGVTLFASSGDGGSNPDNTGATNHYGSSFPRAVEYPASDPYVTAVGGTDLELTTSGPQTGSIATETAWTLNSTSSTAATGGGLSSIYGRPSWQVGSSLPSGNFRAVPDVAGPSSVIPGNNQSLFVVYEAGTVVPLTSQSVQGSGTSFSSPIWAGICACINQQRAINGQPPIGLLGPKIYPLLGSSSFNDITSNGTADLGNGAYFAGAGYDMLTGLGSPNVANLVTALAAPTSAITLDFTGSGDPDILWQNTSTGACGLYLMNGTTVSSWASLGTLSTQWKIVGTGDFLQNGNTDIVWQNTATGETGIYLMSGTSVTGWAELGILPTQWRVAGTGDFLGNGNTDIVLQNSATGDCGIYLMTGTTVTGWTDLGVLPTQWQIAAVGVFNTSGQPNILWHNIATDEYGFYLMNGTAVTGWAELGTIPSPWAVAAVADYNLDGNTDILWRNSSTGECGFYLMSGTSVTGWTELGTVPVQWQIAP
jgi:kumamolisin